MRRVGSCNNFWLSDPYIGNELFNAFTCLLFEQGTEITHGKIGKAGEHRSPEPNVGIVLINKFDGALMSAEVSGR